MAMTRATISIVGCGPGAPDHVTACAREAVARAEVLVGARRLLGLFPDSSAERITLSADIAQALDEIAARYQTKRVAVLVSGDPGVCSLAPRVLERFGRDACEIIPGISSVQVAFARLGLDWFDARLISAHKSDPAVAPETLASEGKIAILAGRAAAIAWIANLVRLLEKSHVAFVCEDLTLEGERIRRVGAAELATLDVSTMAIVVLVRRDLLS